jgi:hypothetical protein
VQLLLLLWTHTRSRMPAAVSGISLMPTYARRQIVAEDIASVDFIAVAARGGSKLAGLTWRVSWLVAAE